MTAQEVNETVAISKQCLEATARIKHLVENKNLSKYDAFLAVFPMLKDIHLPIFPGKMSDAKLAGMLSSYDVKKKRGGHNVGDQSIKGKSASITGKLFGVSTTKIEMTRRVMSHVTPNEIKADVLNGKKSINAAYIEATSLKKKQKITTNSMIPIDKMR